MNLPLVQRYRAAIAVLAANAVALGFGRFAYNALLPQMRTGLDTTSEVMALVASFNLAGYVLGSGVSPWLGRRIRADRVALSSLVVTCVGLSALTVVPDVRTLMALMFVLGMAGALAFVSGVAVLTFDVSGRRGMAFGLATAGIGAGNVVASLVAAAAENLGIDGWRAAWAILAALSAFIVVAIRTPYREAVNRRGSAPLASGPLEPAATWVDAQRKRWIFPAYMSWGLAMIIYSTFFTTFLHDERGIAVGTSASIYSLVGLSTIVGGLAVGPLSDRFGRRRMLAATLLAGASSVAAILLFRNHAAFVLSALLFGLPISGVGTLAMAFISETWPEEEVGPVFGRLTLAFGLTIVAGPSIAALVIRSTGSLNGALVMSLAAVLLGVASTGALPRVTTPDTRSRPPLEGEPTGARTTGS